MAYIDVKNLTFTYPDAPQCALQDVSFSLERGEMGVILGPSAGGKSTLLQLLCPAIAPKGTQSGQITLSGARVGFVHQDTEASLVCDKVYAELAFALENRGMRREKIALKIAETACFLNIEDLFERDVAELSGGQKRMVALAGALVAEPDLLLLDEPVSSLDPLAAEHFLDALAKVNRELGVTVLLSEHIAGGVLPQCDKLGFLCGGRLSVFGPCAAAAQAACRAGFADYMPVPVRLFSRLQPADAPPVSVRGARTRLAAYFKENPPKPVRPAGPAEPGKKSTALQFRDVCFSYDRRRAPVLQGLDLKVSFGGVHGIVGCNGSGKSTLLKLAAGVLRPLHGRVRLHARAAMMPQNPLDLFCGDTLGEDLSDADAALVERFDLQKLLERHPYDVSGGEARMAAFVRILSGNPDILLLDEPTAGCDVKIKALEQELLRSLAKDGKCVLVVSHDMEFLSAVCDDVSLLFGGEMAETMEARRFFSTLSFYTTDARRIGRGLVEGAVSLSDLLQAAGARDNI